MAWILTLFFLVGVIFILFLGSLFMGTMIPSAVLAVIGILAIIVIIKLVMWVRRHYKLKNALPKAKVIRLNRD